jgi:hypothetical protein
MKHLCLIKTQEIENKEIEYKICNNKVLIAHHLSLVTFLRMKKKYLIQIYSCILLIAFISACASSKCECETNNRYSKRKSKISLINYQKNTNFALQKDKGYLSIL